MVEHHSHKIQNIIQKELFNAKQSIKIVVAWFTNDLLFQPLVLKQKVGVNVEIILNKDEINTLLEKCGANPIPCEKRAYDHWSSSEYHAYSAWTLNFTGGSIGTMSKFDNEALTQAYVRYCRDITE